MRSFVSFGAPHSSTPDWWYILTRMLDWCLDRQKTKLTHRLRVALALPLAGVRPIGEILIKFNYMWNEFTSSLTSVRSQKDFAHYKATQLAWNGQNCFVIGAVFFKLPKDKFQRITILIEFSLVQRTQGHVWRLSFERCTSWLHWGWPVASCSVWWLRHNYLRETLWDPAIVTGVKMIDSTRWVTISFMMIFTTGHIKLVNLE